MTAPSDVVLQELARAVGVRLAGANQALVTAESCTGGWIAKACTDVAGSSRWFQGGVVAYANSAKTALLGVPEALIAEHGSVSEPVVRAMAAGLASYKLVALPLYQMADPAVVDRLADWVNGGGSLVLGYRAGARDLRNHSIRQKLPGLFAELAGLTVPRFESLNHTSAALRVGLLPAKGTVWADLIEPESAQPVAVWSDRAKFYRGCPAVTVNRVGKGSVWYMGTSLDAAGIFFVYRRILKEAGLKPRFYGQDLERVRREDGEGRSWELFLNHSPKARRVAGLYLPPWGWAKKAAD